MGSNSILHWIVLLSVLGGNVWITTSMWRRLRHVSRPRWREGVMRAVFACIVGSQALAIVYAATGQFEGAGMWLSVPIVLYPLSLVVAWIVKGFTG